MSQETKGLAVVGLARQSRGEDGSMSVAEQVARLQDQCERDGMHLIEVYTEEDVSGRRPLERRPGLRQAVADIESGRAQAVMVAYFDRLVRSLKTQAEVLERVEAKGGNVIALDVGQISNGTAAQWLSATMIGMVSEYYGRSVSERMRDSKQANIDKGIPPFPRVTPAYQRRADGTLEPHPENAELIREAIRMRLATPAASYATLARWLNERGIKTSPGGVEDMFRSRLLVGEIHFGKFRPNLHAIEEPIIDHATFRRLHATRASRGRYGKSARLLARLGVLRCGTCDARLTVQGSRNGSGKSYPYYRCGDRLCPKPAGVGCDAAEEFLGRETVRLTAKIVGRASAVAELESARLAAVQAQKQLAQAIETLAGLGGEAATREVLDGLQAARDEAVGEHERLLSLTASDVTVTTAADWSRLTFDRKRRAIRAVVARAIVAPGRGPDRIKVEGHGSELLGE